MPAITIALDAKAILAEGPVWCARSNALWWVDIPGQILHRFTPATGTDATWPTPEPAGCLALAADGRVVVALASGLAWFDQAAATFTQFLPIEADNPKTRLNDGRCDRQGRLWVGSMARAGGGPVGTLYRVDPPATLHTIRHPITVPNCTAFSPDGTTMYWADTPTKQILATSLDPETGALGTPRVFATTPRGAPDGGTVDAEGHLWVALWDGSAIARYAPDGTLAELIDLPVRRPTCPCFGGPDLATLYITSASIGLDSPQPGEGGIIALDVGVRGLPETFFGGGS